MAHDAKCFLPCVYSHFRQQLSDNFIPSKKFQQMGRMSKKKRGRAPGLMENKASLRLIRYHKCLHVLIESRVNISK